jgi:hypothetical protein
VFRYLTLNFKIFSMFSPPPSPSLITRIKMQMSVSLERLIAQLMEHATILMEVTCATARAAIKATGLFV